MHTLIASFVLLCAGLLEAGEWPRFRGENGAGVADQSNLPGEIAPDKNVRWKVAIPPGKSSPVVTADRIYLTGHHNGKLLTVALERKSGKVVWTREAPGHRGEKRHQLNDPASPSPVSDGANVYVFFAGYGTTLTEPRALEFAELRRVSDALFLKASYLFRVRRGG